MSAILGFLGLVAVCGLLIWGAIRIEPHWVSKDGERFTCRVQRLGQHDIPEGIWREMRAYVEAGEVVLGARGWRAQSLRGRYKVQTRSPEPPPRVAIWLISGPKGRLVIRVPTKSRAVETLDKMCKY